MSPSVSGSILQAQQHTAKIRFGAIHGLWLEVLPH
jgi:hypothetical protein